LGRRSGSIHAKRSGLPKGLELWPKQIEPLLGDVSITCRAGDHRFSKKITRPTWGFMAVHFAAATIAGVEAA